MKRMVASFRSTGCCGRCWGPGATHVGKKEMGIYWNGNLLVLEFRSIALDLSSLRMFETDPNQSAVLQRLGVEMMYMNVYECI